MPITIKTKKKVFPSRELDQFNIRLPAGLREKLAKLAEKNNRSMNSEIVSSLEFWVARHIGEDAVHTNNGTPNELLQMLLAKIAEDVAQLSDDITDAQASAAGLT